jgi:hypothetical protein
MNSIVVRSRVGPDGVLHLTVPIGAENANREVEVIIKAEAKEGIEAEPTQWRKFVAETAGAWQGELERPEQGDYEQRDALP